MERVGNELPVYQPAEDHEPHQAETERQCRAPRNRAMLSLEPEGDHEERTGEDAFRSRPRQRRERSSAGERSPTTPLPRCHPALQCQHEQEAPEAGLQTGDKER